MFLLRIQIAQLYAECIGLLDHTFVQVKVIPSVPKATFVTIEPHTEDDWEILELNSEHAEQAILKQVKKEFVIEQFFWIESSLVILSCLVFYGLIIFCVNGSNFF